MTSQFRNAVEAHLKAISQWAFVATLDGEPNAQVALGLGKFLSDLDRCKSIDELNEAYMRAQDTLNAPDMKQIDQKYLELKPCVDSNGSLFGAR